MKAAWVAVALGYACGVQAQAYPAKPVRTVVAFAAGGFADTVARLVGQKMSERLGQPVIVENRGGAGGNIGARAVVAAPPDGYTLLVHTAAIAINPSLYRSQGFDLATQLVPVANTGSTPGIFAVHSSNGTATLQDLARAYKGKRLTFATAGVGTSSHLAGEYVFKVLAGINAEHVPFQGGAPALTAIVSNQVDVISMSMPPALPFLRKGTLKALGVSSLSLRGALVGRVFRPGEDAARCRRAPQYRSEPCHLATRRARALRCARHGRASRIGRRVRRLRARRGGQVGDGGQGHGHTPGRIARPAG
jgi:tripartite-type tricarboxylate transporter receptor subunit TctC